MQTTIQCHESLQNAGGGFQAISHGTSMKLLKSYYVHMQTLIKTMPHMTETTPTD